MGTGFTYLVGMKAGENLTFFHEVAQARVDLYNYAVGADAQPPGFVVGESDLPVSAQQIGLTGYFDRLDFERCRCLFSGGKNDFGFRGIAIVDLADSRRRRGILRLVACRRKEGRNNQRCKDSFVLHGFTPPAASNRTTLWR